MVLCLTLIWITNSSDHSRVFNTTLLHTDYIYLTHNSSALEASGLVKRLQKTVRMQNICISNSPVATGIYDPKKSRARHS